MPISITAEQLHRENLRKADEFQKKSDKTPEQLYEEREKRVRDAIQLREPDRVPVRLETHAFPARYVGIPIAASYYDPALWKEATKKPSLILNLTYIRQLSSPIQGRHLSFSVQNTSPGQAALFPPMWHIKI